MDPRLTTIIEELRPLLAATYPDLAPDADVDVAERDLRAFTDLVHVRVARIDGGSRSLVVKSMAPVGPLAERPRLVARSDGAERLQLEYGALRMVETRLAVIDDPTLTAVRAVGILPRSSALVMEAFDGRPLHRVLVRGLVRREPTLRSTSLVGAAGRWLRVLHETAVGDRPARQQTRQEIIDAFSALGAYLAPRMTAHDVGAYVQAGIAAASVLPDRLPMVVSHGDFAPRNILVDGSGRIAVIDLLARWQAPPYEDVAGFLVALHTSRANAVTRGVVFGRALERLEPAFLAGYYGSEAIPLSAIRVYELLLVLDRWASRSSREAHERRSKRLRRRSIDAHFAARSRRLVVRLRQGA